MSKKQSCKELSSLEKLYILLQPYIRRREIKEVLQCTAKNDNQIFDSVQLLMKQKNYRILDYNRIPTKLFMAYCQIDIEDFVQSADIEMKMNKVGKK